MVTLSLEAFFPRKAADCLIVDQCSCTAT
jgi:hypothetical protein